MLEHIDKKDLGYSPNFDLGKFGDILYDSKIEKIIKKANWLKGREARLQRAERFKNEITKEDWVTKTISQTIAEDQIIPMDLWLDKSFFDSGSVMARMHPHFFISFYESLNRWQCTNETLVLLSCKEFKPYSSDQMVNIYREMAEKFGFDLAVLSASICPVYPYDASTQYPFAIYNWPSNRTGQYNTLICQQTCAQLGYMLAKNRYKRVILISSGNFHYQTQFDEMVSKFGDIATFIHLGERGSVFFKAIEKYYKSPGIAASRVHNSQLTRGVLVRLLGFDVWDYFERSDFYIKCFDDFGAIFKELNSAGDTGIDNLDDLISYYNSP